MGPDVGAQLLEACSNGDLPLIESLLKAGAHAHYQDEGTGTSALVAAVKGGHVEVARRLLEAGAPWNAVDRDGKCAGDYAMENDDQTLTDLLIDAGVRAELILGAIGRRERASEVGAASNGNYLDRHVSYESDRLMDAESKGVMMEWERPLMEAHAQAVCARGGHILNVGFGMGLVDAAIQSRKPTSHTIVEAHPDVHARMLASGWGEKDGVKIIFGRWQDAVEKLGQYDGIFFDTYGEYYDDLREFHALLPRLLKPGGIYSFFNGLCATNAFFHVVCCQVVALEMGQLRLSTQFIPLAVADCLDEKTWEGVRNKYWQLDTYFLPVCEWGEEDEAQQNDADKEEEKTPNDESTSS